MPIKSKFLTGVLFFLCLSVILYFTQILKPLQAQADVYLKLTNQVGILASYLGQNSQPGGNRKIVLNGNILYSQLSKSMDAPSVAIDRIQANFETQNRVKSYTQPVSTPVNGPTNEKDLIQNMSTFLNSPFRIDQKGWSAFGKIPLSILFGNKHFPQTETGENYTNKNVQNNFISLAIQDNPSGPTSVWTINFDKDASILEMLGNDDEDTPGADISQIERYPGSLRIFSFSEFSDFSESHIVGYRGYGIPEEHLHYYINLLQRAGLSLDRKSSQNFNKAFALFSGKGREVAVFITRDQENKNQLIDLVQVRVTSG